MANPKSNEMGGSISFTDFPEDVQLCILSFLTPSEVSAFACTSKRFVSLCRNHAKLCFPCAIEGGAPRPRFKNGATARSPSGFATKRFTSGKISSVFGAEAVLEISESHRHHWFSSSGAHRFYLVREFPLRKTVPTVFWSHRFCGWHCRRSWKS